MRVPRFLDSRGSRLEIGSRLSATLGGRLPEGRFHKSFTFETLQRGIHTRKRNFPAALLCNVARDDNAVGIAGRAHYGQQHHELQLAQMFALPHNFYNKEEMTGVQLACCRSLSGGRDRGEVVAQCQVARAVRAGSKLGRIVGISSRAGACIREGFPDSDWTAGDPPGDDLD